MTDKRRRARLDALQSALRRMFSAKAAEPTPDRIRSVVEQMEEPGDAAPPLPRERRA